MRLWNTGRTTGEEKEAVVEDLEERQEEEHGPHTSAGTQAVEPTFSMHTHTSARAEEKRQRMPW